MEAGPLKAEIAVRERLLDAAQACFMEMGYVGTKTRHIARRAGTSETSLFRHFNSKYTLLTAVYDRCWGQLLKQIRSDAQEHGEYEDARDELFGVITSVWNFYESAPDTCALLIINTGNTDSLLVERQEEATISDSNVEYIELVEGLCAKAKNLGLLRDLTPRALAEGLLGISEGVLLGWYLHDHSPAGRYPEKIKLGDAQKLLTKLLY